MHEVFLEIGKYLEPRVSSFVCIGGRDDMKSCERTVESGVQVIVGTLGRTVHMVTDGHLSLKKLKTLGVDEADQIIGDSNFGRDFTTVSVSSKN